MGVGFSPRNAQVAARDYEVVLVTYFSIDQLVGLLSSAQPDQRIVLVDNASGADGTREAIERFPKARWLDGAGHGFAKAANLAARSSDAEYLIFSNPDSRPTPEIWQALVDDLRSDPNLAIVGAGSITESGRLELGIGGWEPTLGRTVVYALGLHRIFSNSGIYARPRRDEVVDLDWLGAPCLAIRRELFLQMGGFDERYFVYNDDMALGRTIRSAGLSQRLRTDLHVPHMAASSGGGTAMFQQRGASMAAYLHHHNSRLPALSMRAMLAGGAIARAASAIVSGRMPAVRQQLAYLYGVISKRSPYAP
jgi:N-acetylglucosaminyl-diphospho-decaprenol L-rhamnosyltransferase